MQQKVAILVVVISALMASVSAHEHKAPHKGTLIEFGEEFAHLELVIDPTTGKVSAYVLDGEAEKAVRVTQKDIEIKVSKSEGGASADFSFTVKAQANVLSGEKEGDTSEFAGESEQLKGLKNFNAVVSAITVKGKEFKDVKFNFPKGNE